MLRVRVFGDPSLEGPAGDVIIRSARGVALIARLALAGPRGVATDVLLDDLWRAGSGGTKGALQVLVSRVRRDLVSMGHVVETTAGGYRLAPSVVSDAHEFEQDLGDVDVAALMASWGTSMTEAPLVGLDDFPFVVAWRPKLLATQASAVRRVGSRLIDDGEIDAAVTLLDAARIAHPYDERLAGLAIRSMSSAGRNRDALLVAQEARACLRDLGLTAGEEIRSAEAVALGGGEHPSEEGAPIARAAQWRHVGRGFDALLAGVGCCVTVTGASGLGKTNLLDRVVQRAQASGLLTLRSGGSRPDHQTPLATVSATRLVAPDQTFAPLPFLMDESNGARGSPYAVLERARRMVADMDAPVAIVIDDLQWADRESITVLRGLCVEARYAPLMLVLAGRPGTAWGDIVGDTLRIDVELGPLTSDESIELAESFANGSLGPRLREAVLAAHGSPVLIAEMLRGYLADGSLHAGRDDIDISCGSAPTTIRALTERRLGEVPASHRMMASIAAVIGGRPHLSLVAQVAEMSAAESRAGVVDVARNGVAPLVTLTSADEIVFVHDLVRDVTYELLDPDERRHWHRRTSSVLLARRSSVQFAAIHTALGGAEVDVQWFVEARDRALSSPRLDPAATLAVADLALERSTLPVDQRLLLQLARAEALASQGNFDEAVEIVRALVHAPGFDTDRVRLRLAGLLLARSQPGAASTVLDGSDFDRHSRARVGAIRSLGLYQSTKVAEAAEHAEASIAAAEAHPDAVATSIAQGVMARIVSLQHRYVEGAARARLAVEFAEADSSGEALDFLPHLIAGLACLDLDDVAGVERSLDAGREAAERTGSSWSLSIYDGLEAASAYRQGDVAACRSAATRSIESDAAIGPSLAAAWTRALLALIALREGAVEPARRLVAAAEAEVQRGCLLGIDLVALARHDLEQALGDRSAAGAALADAWHLLTSLDVRSCLPLLAVPLVRHAITTADSELVASVVAEVDLLAERSSHPPHVGTCRWVHGIIGDDPDAVRDAAAMFDTVGRSLEASDARAEADRLATAVTEV